MTTEEITRQLSLLESHYDEVLESVQLNEIRDEISRLEKTLNTFDERIRVVRKRGYAFDATLESSAENLLQRWTAQAAMIRREISQQTSRLERKISPVKMRVNQLRRQTAPSLAQIRSVSAEVEDITQEIESAEQAVSNLYGSIKQEASELDSRLSRIEWMLDQIATAKFSLLESESGVAACKAIWAKNGDEDSKGDPEGILYLTDQRLIFERKEKVATKKVLFIATEKKLVHELLFEAPVALIENVQAERKGMLKKDDYISLRFASGAPQPSMTFHIWASGKDWVANIRRVQQKDLDRVLEIPEEVAEKVRQVPSQCPACGGTINQVVLRGQDTITCEYCGHVIRL